MTASPDTYVLFTGAQKNIGDFLIQARLEALLAEVRPDRRVVVVPRWRPPTPEEWEQIRGSAALLLGGGPFYRSDLTDIFPVLRELRPSDPPVAFVAGGWKGGLHESPQDHDLGSQATGVLQRAAERIPASCRDYLTYELLQRAGVPARVTGCSAWYDLRFVHAPARLPSDVRAVAFSVPQNPWLHDQAIDLMRRLTALFPEAQRVCSFNRGIGSDANTDSAEGRALARLVEGAQRAGWEARDTSYDLARLDFQDACDLHVGYRVHSHIWFCAARKPSYLVHEDGRGRGVSDALGISGWDGLAGTLPTVGWGGLPMRALRRAVARATGLHGRADAGVAAAVQTRLRADLANGFARFAGVAAVIDRHYEIMRGYLEGLP